jgi:hypothetical protein
LALKAWLRSLVDRPGALALLLSGAVVLVGAVRLYARDPVSQCPPPHGGISEALGIVLVVCCAVSFGIGGLSSETYRFSKHRNGRAQAEPLGPARSRARIAVQAVLVLFLLLMSILLVYETYSLAHSDVAWPITWYVRCVSQGTPATFVVASVMCGLLGHWLWYRPLTRER